MNPELSNFIGRLRDYEALLSDHEKNPIGYDPCNHQKTSRDLEIKRSGNLLEYAFQEAVFKVMNV